MLLVVLTDDNGLNPSDLTTYRTLADNLRPDTRDIVMLQDFIRTPALRDAMTSKDHKAWYLPMVLSGGVGTPSCMRHTAGSPTSSNKPSPGPR